MASINALNAQFQALASHVDTCLHFQKEHNKMLEDQLKHATARIERLETVVQTYNDQNAADVKNVTSGATNHLIPSDSDSDGLSVVDSVLEEFDDISGTCTPPESYTSYCLFQIAFRDDSTSRIYLIKLIGFTLLQFVLVYAVFECTCRRLLLRQWDRSGATYDSSCLYQNSHFTGTPSGFLSRRSVGSTPYEDLITDLLCLCLIAHAMHADDKQTLLTCFPADTCSYCIRFMVFISESLRTFHTPVYLAASAATLLSVSVDSMDTVMNAFALTFVLDLDDLCYTNLLNPRTQNDYQQAAMTRMEASCQVPGKQRMSSLLGSILHAINLLTVFGIYIMHELGNWWVPGAMYFRQWRVFTWSLMCPAILFRGVALTLARDVEDGQSRRSLAVQVFGLAFIGLAAGFIPQICLTIAVGLDANAALQFQNIAECTSGTNTTKCSCHAAAEYTVTMHNGSLGSSFLETIT